MPECNEQRPVGQNKRRNTENTPCDPSSYYPRFSIGMRDGRPRRATQRRREMDALRQRADEAMSDLTELANQSNPSHSDGT